MSARTDKQMAANRKGRQQEANPAAWASEIRAAIAPRSTVIPNGFLRIHDFMREWDLSEPQVRRIIRAAIAEGRIERRYVRVIGCDGRLHVSPVFGLIRKV